VSREETMPLRHETTQDEFQEMAAEVAREREETRMEEAKGTAVPGEAQVEDLSDLPIDTGQGLPVEPQPPAEPVAESPKDGANHKRSEGVKRYWEKRKALEGSHNFTRVIECLARYREELRTDYEKKVAAAKEEFERKVSGFKEDLSAAEAAMLILEDLGGGKQ